MKTDPAAFPPIVRPLLATALILMVPLLAMQVTDEVVWTLADFVVAGVLLAGTGLAFELAAKRARSLTHLAGAGVGLGAALLLVWANLAVGVIGSEDDPANLMYLAVLAVGIAGTLLARFQPRGMARALFATAAAVVVVAAVALVLGLGGPASGPLEIVAVNGLFVALFAASALLFRHAAREPRRPAAGLNA
jgi:hypothetical protein